jgi:hypothetical protein
VEAMAEAALNSRFNGKQGELRILNLHNWAILSGEYCEKCREYLQRSEGRVMRFGGYSIWLVSNYTSRHI